VSVDSWLEKDSFRYLER